MKAAGLFCDKARQGEARQAKEKCSFLKKRTKKLLPGASHDSPRPVPHFKPWRSRAASEGKVFGFFFKKELLPSFFRRPDCHSAQPASRIVVTCVR
jgi:hypothetical protein